MRVNPQIKTTLTEIAKESVTRANNPNPDYKYVKRLLRVFDKNLSEEDRIYLTCLVLEFIHYRNINTDHDTLMSIAEVKVKTAMGISIIVVFVMIIAAILFKTNDHLNKIVEMFLGFTKILSL